MEKIRITQRLKAVKNDDMIRVKYRNHEIIKIVGGTARIDLTGANSTPMGYQRSINRASDFIDLGFWIRRKMDGSWYVFGLTDEIRFNPFKPFIFDLVES